MRWLSLHYRGQAKKVNIMIMTGKTVWLTTNGDIHSDTLTIEETTTADSHTTHFIRRLPEDLGLGRVQLRPKLLEQCSNTAGKRSGIDTHTHTHKRSHPQVVRLCSVRQKRGKDSLSSLFPPQDPPLHPPPSGGLSWLEGAKAQLSLCLNDLIISGVHPGTPSPPTRF